MSEVNDLLSIDPENISGVFRAINKSGNGQIDFPEFIQASLDCNIIVKQENLEKVFRMLAKGDEGISAEKLKAAFGSSPEMQINDSEWYKVIQNVDEN